MPRRFEDLQKQKQDTHLLSAGSKRRHLSDGTIGTLSLHMNIQSIPRQGWIFILNKGKKLYLLIPMEILIFIKKYGIFNIGKNKRRTIFRNRNF